MVVEKYKIEISLGDITEAKREALLVVEKNLHLPDENENAVIGNRDYIITTAI